MINYELLTGFSIHHLSLLITCVIPEINIGKDINLPIASLKKVARGDLFIALVPLPDGQLEE